MVDHPQVARGRRAGARPRDEGRGPGPAAVAEAVPGYAEATPSDPLAVRRSNVQWIGSLIYFVFGVVEILIAIRVFLKLIGANTTTGFTRLIYGLTGPFVAPFQNIVNTPVADNGATFEASSLLAIVIYLILSWLIVRLLLILIARPTAESHGAGNPARPSRFEP